MNTKQMAVVLYYLCDIAILRVTGAERQKIYNIINEGDHKENEQFLRHLYKKCFDHPPPPKRSTTMKQLNTKITDQQVKNLEDLPNYISKADFIRRALDMVFLYIENADNKVMAVHRIMEQSVFVTSLFSKPSNPGENEKSND